MKFKYDWQKEDLIKTYEYDDNTGKYYKRVGDLEIQIDSWNNKVHILNAFNHYIEFNIEELKSLDSLFSYDFIYDYNNEIENEITT